MLATPSEKVISNASHFILVTTIQSLMANNLSKIREGAEKFNTRLYTAIRQLNVSRYTQTIYNIHSINVDVKSIP